MYIRDAVLNTLIFISICVTMQVIVFAFIIYSNIVSSLKLEQVVILSRHNVRTPLSKNLGRMTPQYWPHWNDQPGFLTEKGFILEGYMGKYFHTWLNKHGLVPNHCPSDDDFFVYANTMQRTIYSAKAFLEKCFPICNVTIHHTDDDEPDPIFSPFIHNTTVAFKETALREMEFILNNLNLNNSYEALENILKYKESDFCKIDKDCDLSVDENNLNITAGKKPQVSGPIKVSNEAIDAFLMAYYNGFPAEDIGWGKLKSPDDWNSILNITFGYHNVAYGTTHVAKDIARPLIKYIANIFLNKLTKVTLLMGHDANINVILKAMSFQPYNLEYNFVSTPPGGKIVFQKWLDERTNKYLLKIDYVYQTNEQLRDSTLLSLDNPPKFKHLELAHCKTDEKGFCLWTDFISFLNGL